MDVRLAALTACAVAYIYALARGILGDKRVVLYGPLVLLKCGRCVSLIRRLGCLRIRYVSSLAVASWIASMIVGMLMLLASAGSAFLLTPEQAPPPETLIGLPGLNPLIPITYGVVGLTVAVAVHELAHGAALAANGLPIKSAGLVLLGVPLGAFVEPGDDFQAARGTIKVKVYSSGPFTNLVVASLALLLLAQLFTGVKPVELGVGIVSVYPCFPAEKAGIRPGDIITHIDGVRVTSLDGFLELMKNRGAGDSVALTLAGRRNVTVVLADKYSITKQPADRGKGFLGVELIDLGDFLQDYLPISGEPIEVAWKLLAIPISFQRMPSHLPSFYTQPPGGWDAVYALLWIAWMNVAIGLTNVLPIVPLDGGAALVASLELLLQRLPDARRGLIVRSVAVLLSVLTAVLIVAPVVIPRLRGLVAVAPP